jgi:hypothetical protein
VTYLPKARGHAVATELDAIPWSERAHAHGRGPVERRGVTFDVRAGLAAALGRDEAARDDARAVLFGTLFHQDTTYEATVDAVPLVIAYLSDVDDDAWSKELWLWLGNVALSALLPPAKSASHGGAWGPGVRASLEPRSP